MLGESVRPIIRTMEDKM